MGVETGDDHVSKFRSLLVETKRVMDSCGCGWCDVDVSCEWKLRSFSDIGQTNFNLGPGTFDISIVQTQTFEQTYITDYGGAENWLATTLAGS